MEKIMFFKKSSDFKGRYGDPSCTESLVKYPQETLHFVTHNTQHKGRNTPTDFGMLTLGKGILRVSSEFYKISKSLILFVRWQNILITIIILILEKTL